MNRPLPPNLASLNPLDLRDELARLPQRRGPIGTSAVKNSITIHYAGTPEPGATTDAAALAQIRSEAVYHIGKIWGRDGKGNPIYGDGIMYHLAVLPSGRPVVMRDLFAELYSCANSTGNRCGLHITTLRGIGQAMTDQHWHGVETLSEALIKDFSMTGRQAVKGHREWPRSDGTGQSICPGDLIFARLTHWRNGTQPSYPLGTYEVIAQSGVSVRTGPNVGYKKAQDNTLIYPAGRTFAVDAVVPDERGMQRVWLHDASGIGFLAGDAELCRFVHP